MRENARWSGLDGLRALAVLAVLGTHFGFLNRGAYVGVDLFFVLSGFLITSLLVRERQRVGAISLWRFWLRRGLRLFPALVCAIIFALLVAQWAEYGPWRTTTFTGLPWVFSYLGNWVTAQSAGRLGLLGPTWSLAVEEQFYIVWPLVISFWLARRRSRPERRAVIMTWVACVAGLYNLWAMQHWGWQVAYFRTDTHAMGLCAGSALALALAGRPGSVSLPKSKRRLLQGAALGGFALFAYICIFCVGQTAARSSVMLNAAVLASVAMVAFVVLIPESFWVRLLSRKVPSWIGGRSYGIYLYHYPLAALVVFAPVFHFRGAAHGVAVVICLVLTVVLAAASYRWIETPFLRLKERLSVGTTPETQLTLSPAT